MEAVSHTDQRDDAAQEEVSEGEPDDDEESVAEDNTQGEAMFEEYLAAETAGPVVVPRPAEAPAPAPPPPPAGPVVVPRPAAPPEDTERQRWVALLQRAKEAAAGGSWDSPSESVRVALQQLSVRHAAEPPPNDIDDFAPGHCITYCIVCLRRSFQLRRCLPINLAFAWPHRARVRFALVVYNAETEEEGASDVEWLRANFGPELASGYLVVGTASSEYFHASICKNTSHKLAIATFQGPQRWHCLLNLDGDNLLTPHATASLARALRDLPANAGFRCKGLDGGVTGRVGCWTPMFLRLGGYAEDFYASGYQDMDLWLRCKFAGGSSETLKFSPGASIPNDPDPKAARGSAKIANVAPLQEGVKRWGQMNTKNRNIAKEREHQGVWWVKWPSKPKEQLSTDDVKWLLATIGHALSGLIEACVCGRWLCPATSALHFMRNHHHSDCHTTTHPPTHPPKNNHHHHIPTTDYPSTTTTSQVVAIV